MLVAQLCPTLWDCMDCNLPGSSVHKIPQARIQEWVASPFFIIGSEGGEKEKMNLRRKRSTKRNQRKDKRREGELGGRLEKETK